MIMVVDRDINVRMMFKGNDEHKYVYVSGKDNAVRGVTNAVVIVVRVGRSGKRDDGRAAMIYKRVAHRDQGNDK